MGSQETKGKFSNAFAALFSGNLGTSDLKRLLAIQAFT